MDSIILYFSRDGSTKVAAEYLAEKHNTQIESLKELKPRKGFLISGFRSASGKRPKLAGDPWSLCADKDVIILGSPIWAGNGNPVMNSFLDKADLTGKKVYLFTVQAIPDLKGSDKVLDYLTQRIQSCGGEVVSARAFHGETIGKAASREYMEKQLIQWDITL